MKYSNNSYFNEKIKIKVNGITVIGYTNKNSSLVKVGALYYSKQPAKKVFVIDSKKN